MRDGSIALRWRTGPHEGVWCYEHRFVLGLPSSDVHVHHRNGDRGDNRIENLEILTPQMHSREHRQVNRKAAVALYAAGYSTPKIAAQLGCHSATLSRILRAEGMTMRRSQGPTLDLDEAIRRYKLGAGYSRIAKDLHTSPERLRQLLAQAGVTLRGPGRVSAKAT